MEEFITGIQQVGIGVTNASESLQRYAKLFGMDTLVFDDESEAVFMCQYTGGKVYQRRALLSINLQGGGGFEIWQFKNRIPKGPSRQPAYGDLGIYAPKLKTTKVIQAHEAFSKKGNIQVSSIQKDDRNEPHFWVQDSEHNVFNIIQGHHWFQPSSKIVGGVAGAVIGVSDMDQSLRFYKDLLNVEKESYDKVSFFSGGMEGNEQHFRKVRLQKLPSCKGAFGKLLGGVDIELVQCLDRKPFKIYENRFWGDCGFIHLCMDVFNMPGLKLSMEQKGHAFTVDSMESFGMENASGRFCYVEDPDGTLIELVETHQVPVIKKLGLYFNLKKRNLEKPLPHWMIRLLALSKVK